MSLPRDTMIPILIESTDSLTTLKVYQQVSTGFKAVLDDVNFLKSLLVKFKGLSFSDKIYQNTPRKFLLLDRDITIAFQTIVGKKKDINGRAKGILKVTSSIALLNLNLGVFAITNGLEITHFRMTKTQLKVLEKVDVMDQKAWQECIKNMAASITEHSFPLQIDYIGCHSYYRKTYPLFLKPKESFYKKIESSILNPNEKMHNLIKDYEITDVFIPIPCHLVIHAHKGEGLNLSLLQEAIMEPEEYKFSSCQQLVFELIKEAVKVNVVDGRRVNKWSALKKQKALAMLKTCNFQQISTLEQSISDDLKYMLGIIFPEIWPKIQKVSRKLTHNDVNNMKLIHSFTASIDIECNDEGEYEVDGDDDLQELMLEKLKDPTSGLKEFIEKSCPEGILSLFKKVIFPEIWNGPAVSKK
jgi:hypothetical protein